MSNILQFKITLRDIKPPVWRKFQVDDSITFRDLHLIIQVVMGWTNTHLYQFVYERENYIGNPEFLERSDTADDKDLKLSEIFDEPGIKMMYEYDFGDMWEHELLLEKITGKAKDKFDPVCLDGAMCCPPEDIGGPPGYAERLKILKNKKHPEHREIKEWIGDYNPADFDLDAINEGLKAYKEMDGDFN
jgi:hypothetical protein